MVLKQKKLNVFREISNIGSGNASTSLSKMLNEIVDIGIPKSYLRKFSDIANSYSSHEELVVGAMIQILGDIEGFIIVMMDVDSAINLLWRILGKQVECDKENHEELYKELNYVGGICNILCETYLKAISDMTGLTINQSISCFTVDSFIKMIDIPYSLYDGDSDSILCIETEFFTLDRELEGKYYFIPKFESSNKLLENLGFKV